jgi:predicted MPP superfamily phosphohydrolase
MSGRTWGPFVLAGRGSTSADADEHGAMRGAPTGKPIIMLAHEPEFPEPFAPDAPTWTLAGHTHGGQILLPGLGALPDLLSGGRTLCLRGACVVGTHRVYVTSGVGTSQLPMRIGVPPEIVLLTLTPA